MTRLDFDPDLDRLGDALRASAAVDLTREKHAKHRRVTARRGGALGAVVLASAAAGVIVLVQSSGESAWAKQTLQRAAAVVIPPVSANTILHLAATETLSPLSQRDRSTTVSTLSEDAWIQQGNPWGERVIVQVPGGPVLEENNNTARVYNQTSNTLYLGPVLPNGKPHYTLTPTGHRSYRLSAPLPHGGVSTPQTINAITAKALRDGTQTVLWSAAWNGHTQQVGPIVGSSAKQSQQTQAQQPDPASASFAAELHGLLDSGHARVTKTTTADGQPAIEISSVNPQSGPPTNYYVNPQTYAPIELDSYGFDSPKDVTRIRFSVYQTLPLAGNQKLLHVTVPATAHVDHTPADYWNAVGLPRPF